MRASEVQPRRGGQLDPSDVAASSEVRGATNAQPVILVVDDDADVREGLQNVLNDEGYRVELAATGHDAIRALDAGLDPDLIVLDLRMPIMSGWGVWDHLQLSPKLSTIPVLVFTGTGLSQGSIGDAVVLPKQVGVPQLVATIARMLSDD